MRISDWISDVCSSDLRTDAVERLQHLCPVEHRGGRQRHGSCMLDQVAQRLDLGLDVSHWSPLRRFSSIRAARRSRTKSGTRPDTSPPNVATRSEEHTSALQSLTRI